MSIGIEVLVVLALSSLGSHSHAGGPREPMPFLTLPFKEGTKFAISEGWQYSAEEKAIHGFSTHYGVDFDVPRGTPVLAPADGVAMASFHLAFAGPAEHSIVWNSQEARTYQGKYVGFGLGNFVQIWHEQAGLYTSFAHLEKAAETIPFFSSTPNGDGWKPSSVTYDSPWAIAREGKDIKIWKTVKKGEVIGYAGDSGCSWGYLEQPGQPRPNPVKYPSWDSVHVHMEIYNRDSQGAKQSRYDPYELYQSVSAYQSMTDFSRGLWLLGKDGKPQFAR